MTINGNLTLNTGSTTTFEINGAVSCVEHDQLIVNGTVAINGASLDVQATGAIPAGTILIANDATDGINGSKFIGAPEGGTITVNGTDYRATYTGGDGNDFSLFPDNQAPSAVCNPVTVDADANCQGAAVGAMFGTGSSDPDGDPLTFSVSPAGPYALGSTTVTVSVSDGALTATCQTTITVEDNDAPIAPVLATLTDECLVTVEAPTTIDNCGGLITATTNAPLEYEEQGTFTITWTFADGNGNSVDVDQSVVIEDVTDPTATCAATVSVTTDPDQCEAVVTVPGPTVADNCSVSGAGANFAGDNDRASSFSASPTGPYTVEAWVKPKAFSGNPSPLATRFNGNNGFLFYVYGGSIGYWIWDGGWRSISYNSQILANQWYHIAGSWDGTDMHLYVNGTLVGSRPATYTPSGSLPLSIGGFGNFSYFDGDIDEVRVWDFARSEAEIQITMNEELAGTEAGLRAYYNFNEGVIGGDNTSISQFADVQETVTMQPYRVWRFQVRFPTT